ncbi:hypothetical protein [Streptomyces celluloflavus]|uniref:hypothetical protein n=1 Tax=Streptomyces celluloflavus TaxID=58344 RepID=UPI0036B49BA7
MCTGQLIRSRHRKRVRAQRLVLPMSSLAVLACTFAGHTAVPPTGPLASPTVAVAVAVGTTLSARQGGTPQE